MVLARANYIVLADPTFGKGTTHLSLVYQLPYNDWHYEKWDTNIRRDEITRTPVALQEDRESSDQRNDSGSNETIPRGKGLEGALPRQAIPAESLRFHSSMEADEAETQCSPGDQARDSAKTH